MHTGWASKSQFLDFVHWSKLLEIHFENPCIYDFLTNVYFFFQFVKSEIDLNWPWINYIITSSDYVPRDIILKNESTVLYELMFWVKLETFNKEDCIMWWIFIFCINRFSFKPHLLSLEFTEVEFNRWKSWFLYSFRFLYYSDSKILNQ